MVELQVLGLAGLPTRLFQTRYGWMCAKRTIAAEREPLFEFLSDLENHWLLAEGFVEELRIDGPPGRRDRADVRLRGPRGLRRRARTSVLLSLAPRLMVGRAELGRRTVARVSWVLSAGRPGSTAVELSAVVERVGVLDAVVLLLGGRRWLERRLEATLTELAELAAAPGGHDGRQAHAPQPGPVHREAA